MNPFLFLPLDDGSTIWGVVLDLSLKVTVLYLLAMLLHLLLGRRRPLARSGLWNALLAGLVVLPVATLAFPRRRIDFPLAPASHLVESQQANDATTKPSSLAIGSRIDHLAATFEGDRAPGRVGAPSKLHAPVESETRSWNVRPASVILFFYAAGCMVLSIRLAVSLWMARLLKQTAVPVTDPAWTAGLESWRALAREPPRGADQVRTCEGSAGHRLVPAGHRAPSETTSCADSAADRRGPGPRAGPPGAARRCLEPGSTDRSDLLLASSAHMGRRARDRRGSRAGLRRPLRPLGRRRPQLPDDTAGSRRGTR